MDEREEMVSFQVRLPRGTAAELRVSAKAERRSVASWLRIVVEAELERRAGA